jgi:hypothetical protein
MKKGIAVILVVALSLAGLSGCAHTVKAIEHAKLQTNVKMKDSIFITPGLGKTVFVKVTNTSSVDDGGVIDSTVRQLLADKGYEIVANPDGAAYIIQANVLHFDKAKQGMTPDGMLVGGTGGALAGAVLGGQGWKGPAAGALIGAAVGSLAGAAVGSLVHIDTFIGAIDLNIGERGKTAGTGVLTTAVKQGATAVTKTETPVQTDMKTYQTRMVVWAQQTNMNVSEASREIATEAARQIAALF